VASGVAGRLDFNIDEIEDLRIGVDECCVAILECAVPDASVELVYSWDGAEVLLQAKVESVDPVVEPKVEGITGQILSAVVDKYRFGRAGHDVFFELRKRRGAIGS
jgi:serine/threonine-protein kinase RsbW